MRVVLLGDSHLARIQRDLHLLAPDIRNAAVGGAAASDVIAQATGAGVTSGDVAVLSVGTNDAGWRAVDPTAFSRHLGELTSAVTPRRWIYVAPPLGDQPFTAAASALFRAASAVVVDTPAVLAPLAAAAFTEDGIHLTGAGYALLIPAVAAAIGAVTDDGPSSSPV